MDDQFENERQFRFTKEMFSVEFEKWLFEMFINICLISTWIYIEFRSLMIFLFNLLAIINTWSFWKEALQNGIIIWSLFFYRFI